MSDGTGDPSNSELLAALQGMWRQQKDLVSGVEARLGSKLEAVAEQLETRLGERLSREIQDRPVVVHVDMSRVSELEKQLADLAKRVADLETRGSAH